MSSLPLLVSACVCSCVYSSASRSVYTCYLLPMSGPLPPPLPVPCLLQPHPYPRLLPLPFILTDPIPHSCPWLLPLHSSFSSASALAFASASTIAAAAPVAAAGAAASASASVAAFPLPLPMHFLPCQCLARCHCPPAFSLACPLFGSCVSAYSSVYMVACLCPLCTCYFVLFTILCHLVFAFLCLLWFLSLLLCLVCFLWVYVSVSPSSLPAVSAYFCSLHCPRPCPRHRSLHLPLHPLHNAHASTSPSSASLSSSSSLSWSYAVASFLALFSVSSAFSL